MDALGIVHVGAFVAAGLLLNLTPGPDLLYASTQAGTHGARAGWIAALGIGAGGLVHVALGALGVSALLAASAGAFAALKLAGAAWLAWIGARLLLAPRSPGTAYPPSAPPGGASGAAAPAPDARRAAAVTVSRPARPAASILREAVLVAALNPKVALFFLAFVPQFIDPASPSPALAFGLLGVLFVVNGTLVTGALGTMAAAAAASLRAGPADRGWRRAAAPIAALLPRAVGAALLGLGLRLALAER